MNNYLRCSKSLYYSVVAALPLLIIYEILIVITQSGYWSIRNAADMWIRLFLMAFDIRPQHLTFVMIGLGFVLVPIAKRYSPGIKLKLKYFLLMFIEAFVYSLLLGGLLRNILILSGLSSIIPGNNVLHNFALSLGAGLFEEIIFRVLLLLSLIHI